MCAAGLTEMFHLAEGAEGFVIVGVLPGTEEAVFLIMEDGLGGDAGDF